MMICENVSIYYTLFARILSIVQLRQADCSVFPSRQRWNQEVNNSYSLSNQTQHSNSTCYSIVTGLLCNVSGHCPSRVTAQGRQISDSVCHFITRFLNSMPSTTENAAQMGWEHMRSPFSWYILTWGRNNRGCFIWAFLSDPRFFF